MTSILEIGEGGIDPQMEVRKLQDLVKKLETQNEFLRRKQKLSAPNDANIKESCENDILKPALNNSVFYNTRKHSEKRDTPYSSGSNSLENVDLIDVVSSVIDDEDSWLYTSPRPPTPQQNRMSPYKYMRQDLDNPSPDVQSARKSLKFRLDEVARMSRSTSSPNFQNYTTPPCTNQPTMSLSDSTPPRLMMPSVKPAMVYNPSVQGSRINSGTFTRPKKSHHNQSPTDLSAPDEGNTIHHQNVTDIEHLAKMQEESLRQSMAQSSPRRDGPVRRDSQNSVGSEHSSPPDSPFGSSQHLHTNSAGFQNLRGSVPNMSRLIPRAQHHNSDSSLADFYSEEQALNNAEPPRNHSRLQNSLARPSSPSVSVLKQPKGTVRGSSPGRSCLPTPRRSIPRSAGIQRASGMVSPRRISGLPAPKLTTSRPGDESWREGCF